MLPFFFDEQLSGFSAEAISVMLLMSPLPGPTSMFDWSAK